MVYPIQILLFQVKRKASLDGLGCPLLGESFENLDQEMVMVVQQILV